MTETGHFAELEKILRLTLRENTLVFNFFHLPMFISMLHTTPCANLHPSPKSSEDQIPVDTEPSSADEDDGEGKETNEDDQDSKEDNLQTFIFSATLSKDLQRNVKKRTRPKIGGKKGLKATSTLGKSTV